jgi:hypothetical protein
MRSAFLSRMSGRDAERERKKLARVRRRPTGTRAAYSGESATRERVLTP